MSADPQQIAAYSKWTRYFEQANKDIKLNVDYYSDPAFKKNINGWLAKGTYDLLYWQAGDRLNNIVDQQLVMPIESILSREFLTDFFPPKALSQVTRNGMIQAIPFAQYTWGFYYNKAIFEEHGLKPPKSWEDFIQVCKRLKYLGINPLVQASNEGWPILSWLDYLALDTGGVDFRQKVLNGEPVATSDEHPMVKSLKQLLTNDFFFAPSHEWNWSQVITVLLRKQAAMTLNGQFAETVISGVMDEQLGYFAFPQTDSGRYVVAPTEVFVVSAASTKRAELRRLLRYFMEPAIHTQLALDLGWLPTNVNVLQTDTLNARVQSSVQQLKQATEQVQYFDRETDSQTAKIYAELFRQAKMTGDIAPLLLKLRGENVTLTTELQDMFGPASDDDEVIHLSVIKGVKGSFLLSRLIEQAYNTLGYSVTFTRYPTIEAALTALDFGIDGELARTEHFAARTEKLIRVPEALLSSKVFLVSDQSLCDRSSNIKHDIGIAVDALIVNDWLTQQGQKTRQYADQYQLWQAFNNGEIKQLITFEADLFENRENLPNNCYRQISQFTVYHYVAQRRAELVEPLNKAIIEIKQSNAYQELLSSYGIGLL